MKERYQISNRFWMMILYSILILIGVLAIQFLSFSLLVNQLKPDDSWILMLTTTIPTVVIYLVLLKSLFKKEIKTKE